MSRTFTLPTGQKIRTQSQSRFVLIAVATNTDRVWIEKRSARQEVLTDHVRREQQLRGRLTVTPLWIGVVATGELLPLNNVAREAS